MPTTTRVQCAPACTARAFNYEKGVRNIYFCSINCVPLQEFLPLLQRASFDGTYKAVRWERAAVVNISSILGSVAENNHKEHYHYGPTKVRPDFYTPDPLTVRSKLMKRDSSFYIGSKTDWNNCISRQCIQRRQKSVALASSRTSDQISRMCRLVCAFSYYHTVPLVPV